MSLGSIYRSHVLPMLRACNLELTRFRTHRFDIERTAQHLLADEPVRLVLDVGANVGVTALHYVKQYPQATVHSFEPTPDVFQKLKSNVGSYAQVQLHELAVSDVDGEVEFYTCDHDVSNSMIEAPDRATKRINVKCTTLDTFCREHGIDRIDLFKLDVEGVEPQVLRGAKDVFTRLRPRVVFCELAFRGRGTEHGNGTEVIQQLQEYGYQLFGLYHLMYPAEFGPLKWMDGLFVPRGTV